MGYDFDWSVLTTEYGLGLIDGTWVTLKLTFWSTTFALLLGVIFGTIRWRGGRIAEPICWAYIEFARNTRRWYRFFSGIFPSVSFFRAGS